MVPPLDLNVSALLRVLPPLEVPRPVAEDTDADAETVAVATVLRAGCLRDVLALTQASWRRGSEADREPGSPYERQVLGKWREWVAALMVPRDATWWVEHGQDGAGGVIHAALAVAAESRRLGS